MPSRGHDGFAVVAVQRPFWETEAEHHPALSWEEDAGTLRPGL